MKKIKIIGIGSPFADDQLGFIISNFLQASMCLQPYINKQLFFLNCDRPGVRLLEYMQNVDIVYLVDAVVSGQPLDTIHRLENQEIENLESILSTHAFGVAQTLKLGKALHQLPNEIIFYGIEIRPPQLVVGYEPMKLNSAIFNLIDLIEQDLLANLNLMRTYRKLDSK